MIAGKYPESTRIMYDKVETNNQTIYAEMPMKYITSDISKSRFLEHGNMADISIEDELRAQPTRLNENVRDNVFLSGTAPYKGLNDGPIDVDTSLRFSETSTNDVCIRQAGVINDYPFLDPFSMKIHDPIENPFGVSTRVEYRNKCFKNKNDPIR